MHHINNTFLIHFSDENFFWKLENFPPNLVSNRFLLLKTKSWNDERPQRWQPGGSRDKKSEKCAGLAANAAGKAHEEPGK